MSVACIRDRLGRAESLFSAVDPAAPSQCRAPSTSSFRIGRLMVVSTAYGAGAYADVPADSSSYGLDLWQRPGSKASILFALRELRPSPPRRLIETCLAGREERLFDVVFQFLRRCLRASRRAPRPSPSNATLTIAADTDNVWPVLASLPVGASVIEDGAGADSGVEVEYGARVGGSDVTIGPGVGVGSGVGAFASFGIARTVMFAVAVRPNSSMIV